VPHAASPLRCCCGRALGTIRLAISWSGIGAEGVDCSLVRRVDGARSALASILVDGRGERIIVPFYDNRAQADPALLPVANLSAFDAVLVDVRWPGAAALALTAARAIGRPAILDADTAPLDVLERLVPLASHIVASEPAARTLCGKEFDPETACAVLARRTDAFVAVTAGAAGSWWFDRTAGSARHVAAPGIKAVDTLAAGDVFHGAAMCFMAPLPSDWRKPCRSNRHCALPAPPPRSNACALAAGWARQTGSRRWR
jgi:sulfofructose kinase